MDPKSILMPSFALFIWTILMLLKTFIFRVGAVRRKEVKMSYYRHFMGETTEVLQVHSRNFINLFEIPVLFYVITIFIFMLGKVDAVYHNLAWVFVGSRVLHSLIHTTYNNVNHRLLAYVIGIVCVCWMWIRFFINL